jgi:hypothetical protein
LLFMSTCLTYKIRTPFPMEAHSSIIFVGKVCCIEI